MITLEGFSYPLWEESNVVIPPKGFVWKNAFPLRT